MTPWYICIQRILVILATLGAISSTSKITSYNLSDDRQLRATGIVPSIIEKTPSAKLAEIYSSYVANLGGLPNATRDQVTNQPTIIYVPGKGTYYTLLMLDLDAPTPQNRSTSQILHWGVCDIPGNKVTKGTEFATYLTPTPPTKDEHRYLTIIYKQSRLGECPSEKFDTIPERRFFSNTRYAKAHELIAYAVQMFFLLQLGSCFLIFTPCKKKEKIREVSGRKFDYCTLRWQIAFFHFQ